LDKSELENKVLSELQPMAAELGINGASRMKKQELVMAILEKQVEGEGLLLRQGILDILPEGYGFLRTNGYLPGENDIYVSLSQIRRFDLRRGDEVAGQQRRKSWVGLQRVSLNGLGTCSGRASLEGTCRRFGGRAEQAATLGRWQHMEQVRKKLFVNTILMGTV